MKATVLAAMALAVSPAWCGQAAKTKPRVATVDRDQLGRTCAQILMMRSVDWVSAFQGDPKSAGSEQEKPVRAIAVYGKCYDARTDRLAASLGGRVAGLLTGAGGNFRDFEKALENFRAKALAANDPPAGAVKAAYAALYQKQFRYLLCQSYEKPPTRSGGANPSAPGHSAAPPSERAGSAAAAVPSPNAASTSATSDADPLTAMKNHFGELLDALPEDKMHELHAAFGDIVSRAEMSESTRQSVYRYAIFLLEPSTDQPFSPPPF